MTSRLRRAAFPFRLAGARLGAGGERLTLVAVGIVAGAAAIAAVLGGRLVMEDRSLAQATAKLSPASRSVEVGWFGAFGGTWRQLDHQVAGALERMTGRAPARAMLYREASVDGIFVNLRGADGLARWVRLRSGRLPAPCVPAHCEVVRVSGVGPVPTSPGLRLVQVGTATLKRDAPFASFIQPERTGIVIGATNYHRPAPSPILLAEGVDGLSKAPLLASFFRSYAWFVPLRAGDVHPWSVGGYTRSVEQLRAELNAGSEPFQVTAPTDELAAAVSSSRVAAQRLLLLGGETGALLLAFTVLAAASLRREIGQARRRLVWAGARRWQVELGTFAETGAVAALATLVGWGLGAGIAALVAADAGSPVGDVLTHAVVSGGGIATALAVAAVASLLLYLAVRAPAPRLGRLAVTPLDVAALAAVAVVAVGYARGSVDAGSLATSSGSGTFVLLVPALVTFAASIAAARLLVPALRALGRLGRRGPLALRLAALSLARNPGGATVATTFLVASLGLALFAVTYRATLAQGQEDEAAYAVPAPYIVDEDLSQLVPVLHAWPAPATQVLRLSGNVTAAAGFTFLGVPAAALPATDGWRSDFAQASPGSLAARLAPPRSTAERTIALPPGRTFELPVSATGDDVGVRAYFRSPLGDFDSVDLGHSRGRRTVVLHGRIPLAGARLASLQLELLNLGRNASNGGTGLQPSAQGTLRLGTSSVDGSPVRGALDGWVGDDGVKAQAAPGRIAFALTSGERAFFRPSQPTDGVPLPVLVTPEIAATAGPGGIVPLTIEGDQIAARVVGVVQRFPSVVGNAVIADRETAATALDTGSPGLGTTNELWAQTAPPVPPSVVKVTSRADVLADLQSDPLARGALATLGATAGLALALALLGLLLGVAGDRRDERGELFDLEAQGASPSTLRAHLQLRALLVAGFGLLGGAATGAILSALALSLVRVTASAARPEPPLRLVFDLPLLGLAIGGYLVVAAVLVLAATRLPGRAPARAAELA